MVVMSTSKKEEEFKEGVWTRIWYELVDILEVNGIDTMFLKDSRDIKFCLEGISERVWFWKEKVKKDKDIIKRHIEGKDFERKELEEIIDG